jgi:hypothetical protein
VRTRLATWKTPALVAGTLLLAALTASAGTGQARDRDETVLTVEVSSADHEVLEGYFTLGESATVMARPGSDLYKFLARQRGRRIKVTLVDASAPGLSRLDR